MIGQGRGLSGRRGRTFDDIHTLEADNTGGRAFSQPEGLFEFDIDAFLMSKPD